MWFTWSLLTVNALLAGGVVFLAVNVRSILNRKAVMPNIVESPDEPETGPVEVVQNTADWNLTEAPMVDGYTLRDWLIYHSERDGIWAEVVSVMYTRAAAVPEIFSYFKNTVDKDGGMEHLQKHFTAVLMMVTGQGLTQGALDAMERKHVNVRDEDGRPIDSAIYDMVISTLVSILAEIGVPRQGIEALGNTIAPLKAAIVRA